MLCVGHPYVAWCIDGAVAHFGMALEAELDKIKPPKGRKGKGSEESVQRKRQRMLDKWLGVKLQYRTPSASVTSGGESDS